MNFLGNLSRWFYNLFWGMRFRTCDSGNSSLELHSADLANFGRSQTLSLASHPKFAKNHESQTENPSVVLNAESMDSSLRGRIADSHKAIQKSQTHKVAQ